MNPWINPSTGEIGRNWGSSSVDALIVNRMQSGPLARAMDFLQLRGRYAENGTAGDRRLAFQSPRFGEALSRTLTRSLG
jgi:hypothetical protein